MKKNLLAALAAAGLVACGKDESAAPPAKPAATPAAEQALDLPAPGAPSPAARVTPAASGTPATGSNPGLERIEDDLPNAPANASLKFPVDVKLTEAVHHYLENNGKMPKNFNALLTAKILKAVPVPPPGKRFAIDRQRLQIVIMDQ